MSTITCPKCGHPNRRDARFCQHCGADLSPTREVSPSAPDPGRPSQPQRSGPIQTAKMRLSHLLSSPSSPQAYADRPTPLSPGEILSHPRHPQQQYQIVRVRELPGSLYYDAMALTCPQCGTVHPAAPPDGLCGQCRTPLQPVLIHERLSSPGHLLSDEEVKQLLHLSAGHTGILPHQAIIYREDVYAIVEHPGRWGVIVRGRHRRPLDEAIAVTAQVGQAMKYLHDHHFAYSAVGKASLENLVALSGGAVIKLADLSTCVPLQFDNLRAARAQIHRDIVFLVSLLFYLVTGNYLSRADIGSAPSALRPLIEQAMQDRYASIPDLLTAFSLLPSAGTPMRPLKPIHGQATHPGRVRTRNEDAVVTFTFDKERQDGQTVPIGFYVVADGMGGHDAGDVASRIAGQVVTDWIIKMRVLPDLRQVTRRLTTEEVPGELLVQAFQQANEALLQRARARNSNLGSTLTAALIIEEVATIANVGDSRTYLLRDGRLEQITQDHSLVARLVDAGVIKPEEVRTHPQRSQIYRYVGHRPAIEVDTFTRQLQAGDVLILCSDGLWEMVPDDEIRRIVTGARSPQQACDALVEAANRAGGEDNIAVIVIQME